MRNCIVFSFIPDKTDDWIGKAKGSLMMLPAKHAKAMCTGRLTSQWRMPPKNFSAKPDDFGESTARNDSGYCYSFEQ